MVPGASTDLPVTCNLQAEPTAPVEPSDDAAPAEILSVTLGDAEPEPPC